MKTVKVASILLVSILGGSVAQTLPPELLASGHE